MIKKIVSGTHLFFVISILALFLRWYPIRGGLFTFQYDMAKDSLIMLEMFQYADPSLVGPTTSIPGLFYGPFWYYLALIPSILLNFHPFAGVLVVWLFVVVSIFLLFRFVGKLESFVFAVSSGLIGSQQNAWTPYMTSLIMVPLLVLLFAIKKNAKISTYHLIGIALLCSLFFHFQVAFAIVAVPLVLGIFWQLKPQISAKQILYSITAFLSTLLPSALFELKNNFIQTKSVLAFVSDFGTQAEQIETNQKGLLKVFEVATEMFQVAANAVSPLHSHWVIGVLVLIATFVYLRQNKFDTKAVVLQTLLVGTFLLYLVLPVKAYYLVALFPVWLIAAVGFFKQRFATFIPALIVICTILALVHVVRERTTYLRLSETSNELYAPKLAAVETAYKLAEGNDFASYHFVPQVYDYTYQFIYLNKIRQGAKAPTEFSYLPGEYTYNTYKHISAEPAKSDIEILIVESPIYQVVLDNWWQRLDSNITIEETVPINSNLVVYKVKRNK